MLTTAPHSVLTYRDYLLAPRKHLRLCIHGDCPLLFIELKVFNRQTAAPSNDKEIRISDVYVSILATVSKRKRISRFFWELSRMRKQSIPGRFSPPTQPGYEARANVTLIFWFYPPKHLLYMISLPPS